MVDFSELLSAPVESVKAPSPLPPGNYLGRVSEFEFGKSTKKETPFVRFFIVMEAAQEDVDADELAVALEGKELSDKRTHVDFYLTENSMFRLRNFLESVGIDIEGGLSFKHAIPQAVGCLVVAQLEQTPSQDGETLFTNVKSVVGAPN